MTKVYGSDRACGFLRDAKAGTRSVTKVTIADSNGGFCSEGGSSGGITRASERAMELDSFPIFATSLYSRMPHAGVTITLGIVGSTSKSGFFANIYVPAGNVKRGSADGDEAISALCVPGTVLWPHGIEGFDWSFVDAGDEDISFSRLNNTYPQGAPAVLPDWCEAGTDLIYRVLAARFPGGGQIVPTIWNATNDVQLAAATFSCANATHDLVAREVPFTMPASKELTFGVNYIGEAVGKAGWFTDCIYAVRKGVRVTSLHAHSGADAPTIATEIAGAGNAFWATYFGELVGCQRDADDGGDRVIVHMQFGVNGGGSDFEEWSEACEDIVTAMRAGWVAAGFDPDDLAFQCEVTPPLFNHGYAATEAVMASARAGSHAWAAEQEGVTVVDCAELCSAAKMAANGWYADAVSVNEHLATAGYLGLEQLKLAAMLEYYESAPATEPEPVRGRGKLLKSVALPAGVWTTIAAEPTVGDFQIHNLGAARVALGKQALHPSSFYLGPGACIALRGVDLQGIDAVSETEDASLSVTGLFGGIH